MSEEDRKKIQRQLDEKFKKYDDTLKKYDDTQRQLRSEVDTLAKTVQEVKKGQDQWGSKESFLDEMVKKLTSSLTGSGPTPQTGPDPTVAGASQGGYQEEQMFSR